MSRLFWQLGKITTAVIAASILVANGNVAAQTTSGENNLLELIDQYGELEFPTEEDSMGQINNVFQLQDLSPDHWSFDAVRNLVEKYQCLSGFEDGTFRGELMLNRYQFAAVLNKCLASIEGLIQTSARSNQRGDERVRLEERELRQIKRLTEEFEAELAVLGTRLDDIEGKVDFQEDRQFSTTTKLKGEVIFTLAGAFRDEQAFPSGTSATTAPPIDDNITFSDRVRLFPQL